MGMKVDHGEQRTAAWLTLGHHDWEDVGGLEVSLADALGRLDGGAETLVLHDYVDIEAVGEAFGRPSSSRGVLEVRFEYEEYLVRISRDGTIAVR